MRKIFNIFNILFVVLAITALVQPSLAAVEDIQLIVDACT